MYPSGDVFAVRWADGVIVGCCGPLVFREVRRSYLAGFDYGPDDVEWLGRQLWGVVEGVED